MDAIFISRLDLIHLSTSPLKYVLKLFLEYKLKLEIQWPDAGRSYKKKADFASFLQKIQAPCNTWPPHPSRVAVGGTARTVPHKKRPQTDCDTLQTALSSMTFSWCCHNIVSSKSQLPNLWWVEVTPGVLAHLDNQSERQQRIVGVGGFRGGGIVE